MEHLFGFISGGFHGSLQSPHCCCRCCSAAALRATEAAAQTGSKVSLVSCPNEVNSAPPRRISEYVSMKDEKKAVGPEKFHATESVTTAFNTPDGAGLA